MPASAASPHHAPWVFAHAGAPARCPGGVEPPHKGFKGSAWFRWKAKPWWKGCATRITSLHHPFAKHPSPVSWIHQDCLALRSFGLAQATGAKLCAAYPQHPPNSCCVILVLHIAVGSPLSSSVLVVLLWKLPKGQNVAEGMEPAPGKRSILLTSTPCSTRPLVLPSASFPRGFVPWALSLSDTAAFGEQRWLPLLLPSRNISRGCDAAAAGGCLPWLHVLEAEHPSLLCWALLPAGWGDAERAPSERWQQRIEARGCCFWV